MLRSARHSPAPQAQCLSRAIVKVECASLRATISASAFAECIAGSSEWDANDADVRICEIAKLDPYEYTWLVKAIKILFQNLQEIYQGRRGRQRGTRWRCLSGTSRCLDSHIRVFHSVLTARAPTVLRHPVDPGLRDAHGGPAEPSERAACASARRSSAVKGHLSPRP